MSAISSDQIGKKGLKVKIIAILVFVLVIGLIISEKVHRAAAALAGAVVLILTGVMSGQKALSYIDFNTIGVLVGTGCCHQTVRAIRIRRYQGG